MELTRNLAQRFNHRYGDTFTVPEPYIPEVGARIMSLDDASKKMSKSNPNPGSYISMLDEPDVIIKKIKRAKTDSDAVVKFDTANKPEISNLLSIYAQCSGMTIPDIEAKYEGQGYGKFKQDLAEYVVETLKPIQERYNQIRNTGEIQDILKIGAEKANEHAEAMLAKVKQKIGFLLPT